MQPISPKSLLNLVGIIEDLHGDLLMIRVTRGNILDAEAEALVNTVNTVGVMGKGIALQFKRAFPENFKEYERACKAKTFDVGTVLTVKVSQLEGPRYVINFPTKRHWKGKSKLEFIESGLEALAVEIERLAINSIAIPPLGCGLGGLNWPDVFKRIQDALGRFEDVDILVFEPAGKPAASEMKTATERPAMTAGKAALLGLMKRYMVPLMDEAVTLLELHKLMYFMQETGEKLRLQFVKGNYGPYAQNLRHVLTQIEGHYLNGFSDASEEPGKILEPLPGAMEEAEAFLKKKPQTHERFERVERLIEGFETAYGLELLASVHWVAKHEKSRASDTEEAIRLMHEWNVRKRESFAAEHIRVAWDQLVQKGWL